MPVEDCYPCALTVSLSYFRTLFRSAYTLEPSCSKESAQGDKLCLLSLVPMTLPMSQSPRVNHVLQMTTCSRFASCKDQRSTLAHYRGWAGTEDWYKYVLVLLAQIQVTELTVFG